MEMYKYEVMKKRDFIFLMEKVKPWLDHPWRKYWKQVKTQMEIHIFLSTEMSLVVTKMTIDTLGYEQGMELSYQEA